MVEDLGDLVADDDLDAVGDARARGALVGPVRLLARQRDAGAERAVVLGGVRDERAPATADVEKVVVRLEVELVDMLA